MLSLLLAADALVIISVMEENSVLAPLHQAKGLADTIAVLSDVGILGASFSVEMLDAAYFPSKVECRSVGSFVPEGSNDGRAVRYSRTTDLTSGKGQWLIARDWIVLFP